MPPQIIIGVPLFAHPPSVPPAGMHERFQKDLWGLRLRAARSLAGSIGGGGSTEGLPWGSQSLLRWVRGLDPKNGAGGKGECQYWGGCTPKRGWGGPGKQGGAP